MQPVSLLVCFIHHPGSHLASSLRSRVYKHYRRDPHKNLGEGGLGLEVEYRSDPASPSTEPIPVDYDRAQATAVVAIFDRELASDPDLTAFVRRVAQGARGRFPRAAFLAVATDDEGHRLSVGDGVGSWQALDARTWSIEAGRNDRRLFTAMDQHLCRLIAAYLESRRRPDATEVALRRAFGRRAQVFLSHSKHDHDNRGEEIALRLRSAFAELGADAFFDATDLVPGTPWEQALDDAASSHALVAILTDSYSSRTWCRREILAAKRSGIPFLIASCLEDFEGRSFPYAGNVPVVQMAPDPDARQPQLVGRLFDELLRDLVWKCHTVDPAPARTMFRSHTPELVSLAYVERDLTEAGSPHAVTLVYPGAPLGAEEEELFAVVAPHVRLLPFVSWKAGLKS